MWCYRGERRRTEQCQCSSRPGTRHYLKVLAFGEPSLPLALALHWGIMWPVEISHGLQVLPSSKLLKGSHLLTIQLESPRHSLRQGLALFRWHLSFIYQLP